MPRRDGVLVTWLAFNNDPYERGRDRTFRLGDDGAPVRGPTMTLLFDETSEFRGRIGQVVMFVRDDPGDGVEVGGQKLFKTGLDRRPTPVSVDPSGCPIGGCNDTDVWFCHTGPFSESRYRVVLDTDPVHGGQAPWIGALWRVVSNCSCWCEYRRRRRLRNWNH